MENIEIKDLPDHIDHEFKVNIVKVYNLIDEILPGTSNNFKTNFMSACVIAQAVKEYFYEYGSDFNEEEMRYYSEKFGNFIAESFFINMKNIDKVIEEFEDN